MANYTQRPKTRPPKSKIKKAKMSEETIYEHVGNILDPDMSAKKKHISTEALIKQFAPLFHKSAAYYIKKRNDLRDHDDFLGAAQVALVKCIHRFQPNMEAKFITFLTNGIRNELIGIFRKQAKQGTVEAINTTSYFHYQSDVNLAFPPIEQDFSREASKKDDSHVVWDFLEKEEAMSLTEEIITEVELTVPESLYFFMLHGLTCRAYSHKEIRKHFKLNKLHLESASLKVYSYFFNKRYNTTRLDH